MRVLSYVDDSEDDEVVAVIEDALTPEEAELIAAERRFEYYVGEIESIGGVVTISPILRSVKIATRGKVASSHWTALRTDWVPSVGNLRFLSRRMKRH